MARMAEFIETHTLALLVLACAAITYFTRVSGYWIIARFKAIPPRLDAALQAVPAAVLATLVFPPALTKGPVEGAVMLIAVFLCIRFSPIIVLIIGLSILVVGRTVTGL